MPANAKKTVCKDKYPLLNPCIKRNGREGRFRVEFRVGFFFLLLHFSLYAFTSYFYKENVTSVAKKIKTTKLGVPDSPKPYPEKNASV